MPSGTGRCATTAGCAIARRSSSGSLELWFASTYAVFNTNFVGGLKRRAMAGKLLTASAPDVAGLSNITWRQFRRILEWKIEGITRSSTYLARTGVELTGGDRHGAQYFTLDLTYDPAALVALAAYAEYVKDALPELYADPKAKFPI